MAFEDERRRMVDRLMSAGIIRDEKVRKAMLVVERHIFLPEEMWDLAYIDRPLDIGHGQTISAPHMVAIMVSAFELGPGMKVLEVGGGSGYHAAVMAELVRPGGKVISIEVIKDLAEAEEANLKKTGHDDIVTVVVGDGSGGMPEEAPFDRISVAAAGPNVPKPLVDQLADGGMLLVPVGGRSYQELMMVNKVGDKVQEKSLGGVMFVPLVGVHGQNG